MVGMNGVNTSCPSPAKAARPHFSRTSTLVALACRYVVGGVFLMAAVSKIVNFREFESQILLHSPLPQVIAKVLPGGELQLSFRLSRIVAAGLPWLELTCGLCLVFRWAVRESALIISSLLSLFILQTVAFRSEDCHCFFMATRIRSLPWFWHAVLNALLLGCSLYLTRRNVLGKDEGWKMN